MLVKLGSVVGRGGPRCVVSVVNMVGAGRVMLGPISIRRRLGSVMGLMTLFMLCTCSGRSRR